ncbi:MAG TPA: TonB-dependent siderophore receptor [Thermoanaerobaculia bacterium]|nr:TonB-dependent siderophore receptor [Thermoanaerobaculia bacterium]
MIVWNDLLVRRTLVAGAFALILTLPAVAQEPSESVAEPETIEATPTEALPRVQEFARVEASLPYAPSSNTIATKLPTDLKWTPAIIGVVESPVMDERNARILGDALASVAGVNVQTGAGVFDFFVLRGFDSLSSAQVLTDGAPEPEATFYQLYNVERVEVFKGPASFLYGSNPLSGAVNLVRKQPIPVGFARFEVGGGSFGTLEGEVDAGTALGSDAASFRLNGMWRESDGFRDGKESSVWAVNPAFTFLPSEATTINLNLELASSDFVPDGGQPFNPGRGGRLFPVSRELSYDRPGDFSEQEATRAQLDVQHRFSGRFSLRNKAYYRGLDWQTAGTLLLDVREVPFLGTVITRGASTLDDDQRFFGNQLEAIYWFETGSVRHRLLAGVELFEGRDEYTVTFDTVDLVDPEANVLPFPVPPAGVPDMVGDTRTRVLAPYLIDQIIPSERWQILLGARFDSIDFEDEVSGTERSDDQLSPMLGVVFQPVPGTSLYANVSEAFAPPSPRVVGERRPEESRQVEVGIRQKLFGDRLSATLAAFEIERENIAIADDNGFTQQAGDQRSRGLELELAGDLTPDLSLLFSWAYTDSELTRFNEVFQVPGPAGPIVFVVDRSGNRAPFAPEHLGTLWLSYRLAGGFRLGGGGRYLSDQFIAEDNVHEIPGYFLADAALSWSRNDLVVSLNGRNLTDEDYETRAFGSLSVIPAESRSFSLRVGYRLP